MLRRRSALLICGCLGAPAGAAQVEVFTDQAHPVVNAEAMPTAVVYYVDALPQTLERLSKDLPANPERAATLAQPRLSQLDRAALERAAQGLVQAKLAYGLDRYPAIVFDGQAVVYGVTDLSVAHRYYEQWRDDR